VKLELPALSLYAHLPWCVRKCPYCDFNSHAAPAVLPAVEYVDALLDDLELSLPAVAGRSLHSVFLGGGTPSLFPPVLIARLLEGIARRIEFEPDVEVTMEANPGTLERGRFGEYRGAGVTRLSLGAQSFDAGALQVLGRIHGPDDTDRAVAELVAAGFRNFNLDLMFALPGQTVDAAIADLEHALALGPTHLSHYQLTLEPGTVFYHRPPPLPDGDTAYAMQLECEQRLAAAGFEHYEVSAHARPDAACRHNLNYWRYGDYLGIGAGAHGKWTDTASGRILRSIRRRQPREYLGASRPEDRVERTHEVPAVERPFEFLLNVLRLREGFTEETFEARTGVPMARIAPRVHLAQRRGLLDVEDRRWRASELGLRFLNDLQALFLPETAPSGPGVAGIEPAALIP
jgi:putative oxygen-independent coproporphyrinogen III oxidase